MMGPKSIAMIALGAASLAAGYFIGNVHFLVSLGPIFASGVLITLGLLLRDTDEGVDSDTYKVYAYFFAAAGAVATAVALFASSKIVFLIQQSGLDIYLELGLALTGAAVGLILFHIVSMFRALSAKSVAVEVEA
jgi:hypothetical protein